ncbi:MAG: LPS export ABC transporter periplasmic protein LptC [Treponema sp.]|jgi:LPS export ABC transporter protein LptC|nr:LPS export ABC transporter periplasmic protein LptC [Treponema sp.]
MKQVFISYSMFTFLFSLIACSFDYGSAAVEDNGQPDIMMNDVEYVRVRDGEPLVRFTAGTAERYEKRQLMELKELAFEQFQKRGEEVTVGGAIGSARIEIDTGNIQMDNGITMDIQSEDVSIKTDSLKWEDKTRTVSADMEEDVNISRSDGTSFTGKGFSANTRERTWSFASGASGVYFQDDDKENKDEKK